VLARHGTHGVLDGQALAASKLSSQPQNLMEPSWQGCRTYQSAGSIGAILAKRRAAWLQAALLAVKPAHNHTVGHSRGQKGTVGEREEQEDPVWEWCHTGGMGRYQVVQQEEDITYVHEQKVAPCQTKMDKRLP